MTLDFKIFIDYQLRLIPTHKAIYDPKTDTFSCTCYRKQNCICAGKHAVLKDWINSPIPPNTPETIQLIQQSSSNFGIATGILTTDPSLQLIVIDVDYPEGINDPLIPLLPPTLTVLTPNQGIHFYFFLPTAEKIPNLSTGYIDIRSQGGLVICPPSQGYVFSPLSLPTITTLPTMPTIPKSQQNAKYTPQGASSYNYTSDGLIPIGERDSYVFSRLRQAAANGYTLSELLSLSDSIYNALEQTPRNQFPLSAIREKAYYVNNNYSDPDAQAFREEVNRVFPASSD